MTIRLAADGDGGGGGGNQFLTTLPEDIRGEPSLQTFKDVGTLAKSFVEAQKLIGSRRVAIPGEKAADAEWDTFYNNIGRPGTPDLYEDVVLKDETGKVLMEPDKAQLGELKKFFHKMGLTGKQARMMQEYSLGYLHKNNLASAASEQERVNNETAALREDWGESFDKNVDVARSVIKKFGDQPFLEYIEKTGMGNNAQLIRLLHKVGTSMLEDTGRRGGDPLPLNDSTRAMNEIELLKTDVEFQKALGDPTHVGHTAAVNRWTNLFRAAHAGAVAD